jgi:hypothetical protein
MTRGNKHKTSVLADVFGINLVDGGDTLPPPDEDPAAAERIEAMVEERVATRERAAAIAEIRYVAAEAAKKAGVKQARVHSFAKLLDLSGVSVDSDGEPDRAEIERLVRGGIEEYPELAIRGR